MSRFRAFSPMRAPQALLAAAVLATTTVAQTVTTVLNNGTTQTRYDIVILGDGYQASEQTKFNQDVQAFLTSLFQHEPYLTFGAYYNVHTVFRASVDSGADRPDETPPVFKNTVYDATYNYGGTDRCLYIQNTSQALADATLAPANEGRILVMVNDTRYGGCAATFAVSYTGSWMSEVQIHEMGHSVGQLADEYDYPYTTTYSGSEPSQANITKSATGQKWSLWQGTDGISAFEGAGYYLYGLYRPKANCLMRSLGVAMCRVCQEGVVKITNSITNVITSAAPAAATVNVDVPNLQPFSITHFVPAGNNPLITWRLDGQVIAGATGSGYVLDPAQTSLGSHTLSVTVKDQTALVRNDPANVMTESHSWQVVVADPTAAQLRFTAFSGSTLYVQPGSPLLLNATVVNDGPGAAGPFDVDFFVSTSSTWNVQTSTWLGKTTVNTLGAGQSAPVQRAAQLPWSLPAQLHYLFAVADRSNVVHESNENDNTRLSVALASAGPCGVHLEFHDPMTLGDAGTIAVGAGGALHPTVVAPCANPATTLYLIVWGGSGTSPGFPLSAGLTLPLNPDSFTALGLDGLNGPVFASFLGLLDAAGEGHATFTMPPLPGFTTGQTHFAAVLLGSTQLFTDVSNPIGLTLVP